MFQESILKQFEVGDLIEHGHETSETYLVLRKSADGELYELFRQSDNAICTLSGYRINFFDKI